MRSRMLALVALVAIGCMRRPPADMRGVELDVPIFGGPRPCTLAVSPVIDARPTIERERGPESRPRFKTFVPLLVLYVWERAGPRYGRPHLYADSLLPDMRGALERALARSEVCAGGGPGLTVQPTLRHYYGVTYVESFNVSGPGAGSATVFNFFPSGAVELELELLRDGRQLDRVTVAERYLYNPELHDEWQAGDPLPPWPESVAPLVAFEHVLRQVPGAVDRMLARVAEVPPGSPETFLVVRLTPEYDFMEEMLVETATGRIVTDRVVRRRLPVLGAVGEWLVAPVDAEGRWMTPERYRAHVDALSRTYDVAFDGNLTAATFGGLRR